MGEALLGLGVLLVLATYLGRAARLVGLPSVPIYMLVGLLASPAVGISPLHISYEDVQLLATVGLVLLLFHLGLEFDTAAFAKDARTLILAGVSYIVINFGAGLLLGFALGWGGAEAFVIAGMTGISSSAIVTKLMIDLKKLGKPETSLILGTIVIEDVFLALYLAILNVLINPADNLGASAVKLLISVGFLILLFIMARRGSRIVSRIVGEKSSELFIVGLVGITLFFAGAAEELGVSDAIGAFMVGLIVAGTDARHRAETAINPLRDTFAAVFFIGFGLTLDPSEFGQVLVPVIVAVLITLVANVAAGVIAGRLQRLPLTTGVEVGLMLVSRGEFALILATMAAAANLDPRLTPFAGLYVLVLAILGPILATYGPRLWRGKSEQASQEAIKAVPRSPAS
ncbi:cation:proton antiporter [Nesterenkonia massiliensis]|uniref:cation:proton antiporter n=1 Tax=Nesterenkonia massiliensis TaxID=1232429 RepID=UPI00041FC99C|nr:cation:proton antiporter [Nesterenkonia massiliensis]